MVEARTPEQPAQRFEHYELVTGEDGNSVEPGRGAMGVTYKAFDVDLRCPVTLKAISERYLGDKSARLRFLREARAAASVRHPNVASVFHLGRTGSGYFYGMEFVEGETLENLIKRSGRLDVKLALEIAAQVAAGLGAIHEENLVHRDIKPTNIMVRLKEGSAVTAKIIDLGLAKSVDASASEAGISSPGAFAGTPDFASPVPVTGEKSLIPSTDTLVQMRDTYQSAAYLAVSRLVHTVGRAIDTNFFAFPLPGLTYRIGNTEPELLNVPVLSSTDPASGNTAGIGQTDGTKSLVGALIKPIAEVSPSYNALTPCVYPAQMETPAWYRLAVLLE
jgi:serine/threonine protein kinase